MTQETLTAERLRALLNYDPGTGLFTYRNSRGRCRAGSVAGSFDKEGYVVIGLDYRAYKAHRLAWLYVTGAWPADQIDHIDGKQDNNRWANLRDADPSVNAQNRHRYKGVPGVTPAAYGRFRAQIHVQGQKRYLGSFRSAEEAHAAYITAKRALHAGCTI